MLLFRRRKTENFLLTYPLPAPPLFFLFLLFKISLSSLRTRNQNTNLTINNTLTCEHCILKFLNENTENYNLKRSKNFYSVLDFCFVLHYAPKNGKRKLERKIILIIYAFIITKCINFNYYLLRYLIN